MLPTTLARRWPGLLQANEFPSEEEELSPLFLLMKGGGRSYPALSRVGRETTGIGKEVQSSTVGQDEAQQQKKDGEKTQNGHVTQGGKRYPTPFHISNTQRVAIRY